MAWVVCFGLGLGVVPGSLGPVGGVVQELVEAVMGVVNVEMNGED